MRRTASTSASTSFHGVRYLDSEVRLVDQTTDDETTKQQWCCYRCERPFAHAAALVSHLIDLHNEAVGELWR
jgi:hypothetical protein